MTLRAALLGREELLSFPELPTPDEVTPAFERDLATTERAVRNDPLDPNWLKELAALYEVADLLGRQQAGMFQPVPPADIEAKAASLFQEIVQRQETLDERILIMLRALPQNPEALLLAADRLTDRSEDPLEAARFRMALAQNAIVYTNHDLGPLGEYVRINQNIYPFLQMRIQDGQLPAYPQEELDTVFVCPLVRALRLLDEACGQSELENLQQCHVISLGTLDKLRAGPESPLVDAEARGACSIEREGRLNSIKFTEVDLGL